ncbi:hypothetical protein CEUSTIGMA_g12943.t1 [Chlamydomonas eustigma]|uniref:Uncharacterized protein n=1 Tax=Chlamydomonas eustigma TaxID=1157962 RepID=A0A250XR33_9CHLO|nr:hypothetical protein CEUSTIGMA_g12943.t1 [Chlamydomonas eustigma]|eukprot:GAX85527.1 hypothetical protein CEUSTIGMA_g12943.t1 [Chlamydomonas eustigma]
MFVHFPGHVMQELTQLSGFSMLKSLIVWSSLALEVQEMVHHMQVLLGIGGQGAHQQQQAPHGGGGGDHAYVIEPVDQNFNAAALNNNAFAGLAPPIIANLYSTMMGSQFILSSEITSTQRLLQWLCSMPSLTCIDIQMVDMSTEELECLATLPALAHLGVGDLSINKQLLQPLTALTKLVLHGCAGSRFLPNSFPNLRALSCDACNLTLRNISTMTGLEHLLLWQPDYNSELSQLSELHQDYQHVYPAHSAAPVHNAAWGSSTGAVAPPTLEALSTPPESTAELLLAADRNGVHSLPTFARGPTSLNHSVITPLTTSPSSDTAAAAVSAGSVPYHSSPLTATSQPEDHLHMAFSSTSFLTEELGDSGLWCLRGVTGLKELRLEDADGVTDMGWSMFCCCHTQLTRLHLIAINPSNPSGLSSVGLTAPLKAMRHLTYVLLCQLPQLTEEGLALILEISSLSTLEIVDCDSVNQAHVVSAMSGMTRVRVPQTGAVHIKSDLDIVYRRGGATKHFYWPA